MKTLNNQIREAFMDHNPTLLKEMVNHVGQVCRFYEHPLRGDEAPVHVDIEGVMANTSFYDLGDFYEGSDYMPELFGCVIDCKFEIDKIRHEPFIEPQVRENLEKLRDFLVANNVKFHMIDYRVDMIDEETGEYDGADMTLDQLSLPPNECGTAGCAIGWAPFIIPPEEGDFVSEMDYDDPDKSVKRLVYGVYANRVFKMSASHPGFEWMFDALWARYDNTRLGAAFRIDRYLSTAKDEQDARRLKFWADRIYSNDEEQMLEYVTVRGRWLADRGLPTDIGF